MSVDNSMASINSLQRLSLEEPVFHLPSSSDEQQEIISCFTQGYVGIHSNEVSVFSCKIYLTSRYI